MEHSPRENGVSALRLFLCNVCADAVAILSLFYFFAVLFGFERPSVTASRFFLILLFSLLAEGAHLLLVPGVKGVPKWIARVLHYAVLLASFLILSVSAGLLKGSSSIFVGVFLFTLAYVLTVLAFALIRKIRR